MADEPDTFDAEKFEDIMIWDDAGETTIDPIEHIRDAVDAALEKARKEARVMAQKGFNRIAAHIEHETVNITPWLRAYDREEPTVQIHTEHFTHETSLRLMILEMIEHEWGTKEQIQAVLDGI